MNIFILDEDTALCARYHCDRHVVKMILESAQMLSTVCRLNGLDAGYKITHQNHPCTKWAAESLSNWWWLHMLALDLNKEWQFRFGHTRNHKSCDVILDLPEPSIEDKGLTPFARAMPSVYSAHASPVLAYREYYKNDKAKILTYTKREPPSWLHV